MCVRESMRENGSRSKTKLLQFDGFADQLFVLVYVRVINVRDALDTGIRCSRCFNLIILMFRGSLGCDCHMRDVTRSRIKCRRRTVFALQMFAVSANTGEHRPPASLLSKLSYARACRCLEATFRPFASSSLRHLQYITRQL